MAEKNFRRAPAGGVAKMQFWKGQNSKLNYWAKIVSAEWQRKIFSGLPQGGSQNAIWEWPKLKIELFGRKCQMAYKNFCRAPAGG